MVNINEIREFDSITELERNTKCFLELLSCMYDSGGRIHYPCHVDIG